MPLSLLGRFTSLLDVDSGDVDFGHCLLLPVSQLGLVYRFSRLGWAAGGLDVRGSWIAMRVHATVHSTPLQHPKLVKGSPAQHCPSA